MRLLGSPHVVLDHPDPTDPTEPDITPTLKDADQPGFFPTDHLGQLVLALGPSTHTLLVIIVVLALTFRAVPHGQVTGDRPSWSMQHGDDERVQVARGMRQTGEDDGFDRFPETSGDDTLGNLPVQPFVQGESDDRVGLNVGAGCPGSKRGGRSVREESGMFLGEF